jgi:hypothetical protein
MAAMLAHGLVDNTLFFPDLALVFFLTLALAQRAHAVSSSDAVRFPCLTDHTRKV